MVPVGRAYRAARSRTSASREACNSEGSKAFWFCSARRAPTTCPASDPRSRMACLMVGYLPRDKQRRGLSREMKGAVMPGSEAAPRLHPRRGSKKEVHISMLRSQVGFAAAVAHARLRLSRLELIGGSGPLAAPPAVTHLPRAPSFRRPPSSRRGEALWERVEAGSGSLRRAHLTLNSSESAAGSGRLRACGCSCGC